MSKIKYQVTITMDGKPADIAANIRIISDSLQKLLVVFEKSDDAGQATFLGTGYQCIVSPKHE
jgi:hypothetical protein